MIPAKSDSTAISSSPSLANRYRSVRAQTLDLCRYLAAEDYVVQSMQDVSPVKWHLAHTTWFFEHFVLQSGAKKYQLFDDKYHYLFNSYYYSAGQMHERPQRGLLSRPLVQDIFDYRRHVDDAIYRLLQDADRNIDIDSTIILGLNHEQQHQELILTDIKHVFSANPLQPAVHPELRSPRSTDLAKHEFLPGLGGIQETGASGSGFCFDNELPRHTALLHEHAMGSRLISNGEYLEFIDDGGYKNCELWLSDGWATINRRGWNRPLYWSDDRQSEFTLGGQRELHQSAPVCHISFYEADAFARWAGARLPTEFEWECAARDSTVEGNLMESLQWHPAPAHEGANQYFGDVWEWTSSAYAAYPGFKPLAGSLAEYNGKFMCSQISVRGGSCVTSKEHIRASYRSFFYPDARWQFLGIRLAKDGAP